jgi:hypothetical protein
VRDALSGLAEHHPFLLPEIFDLIHATPLTIVRDSQTFVFAWLAAYPF